MKPHISIVVILLAVLLVPLIVTAQFDERRSRIEIEGIVETTSAGDSIEVSINGLRIMETESFDPALLSDGSRIIVRGYLDSDGLIEPTHVQIFVVDEDPIDDGFMVEDMGICTPRTDHKQVIRISESYNVQPEIIAQLHCEGHGFGNLRKAFYLAFSAEGDLSAQDYLDLHQSGLGWGEIYRLAGVSKKRVKA